MGVKISCKRLISKTKLLFLFIAKAMGIKTAEVFRKQWLANKLSIHFKTTSM